MESPATIFIVDRDVHSQNRVQRMADEMGAPCEAYENAEDFLADYKKGRPGCVVAEFRLSGINGLELQASLAEQGTVLPTFFLTRHAEVPIAVQAMQQGALTVLQKTCSEQELWDTLHEAVTQVRERHAASAMQQRILARLAALSRHEQAILPFVLAAMSDKRIARQLEISKRAVRQARRSIFKKTRTRDIAELLQVTRVARRSDRSTELRRLSVCAGREVSQQLRDLLDKQCTALERASQAPLRELLGEIVHEIGQPLQAIASSSDVISGALRQETIDVSQVREWNQMIAKATRLAAETLSRFRSVVAQPRGSRREESLAQVVDDSILMLQFTAREQRVEVGFERNDSIVLVDRVQIQQVLINLLKNAIDAVSDNPPGERVVTVRIDCDSSSAEILVSDNGNGIAETDTAVFEPFISSKDDGLGLGLATSKTIVESHGGQIWHEPNHPRGAIFHVRLPLPNDPRV